MEKKKRTHTCTHTHTLNFTFVGSILCGVDQNQGHDAAHGSPHVTKRLKKGDELLSLSQVQGVGGQHCKVTHYTAVTVTLIFVCFI